MFANKNPRVILDEPSESDYSSSSEDDNSPDEGEKTLWSTTQNRVTATKAATSLPTPRRKPETMVAEMDLLSIILTIVNITLSNTNSVLTI